MLSCPSYDPGFGLLPVRLTMIFAVCPAAIVTEEGADTRARASASRCATAILSVAELLPALVRARVTDGRGVEIRPKPMVGGSTEICAPTAAWTLSLPAPTES